MTGLSKIPAEFSFHYDIYDISFRIFMFRWLKICFWFYNTLMEFYYQSVM